MQLPENECPKGKPPKTSIIYVFVFVYSSEIDDNLCIIPILRTLFMLLAEQHPLLHTEQNIKLRCLLLLKINTSMFDFYFELVRTKAFVNNLIV